MGRSLVLMRGVGTLVMFLALAWLGLKVFGNDDDIADPAEHAVVLADADFHRQTGALRGLLGLANGTAQELFGGSPTGCVAGRPSGQIAPARQWWRQKPITIISSIRVKPRRLGCKGRIGLAPVHDVIAAAFAPVIDGIRALRPELKGFWFHGGVAVDFGLGARVKRVGGERAIIQVFAPGINDAPADDEVTGAAKGIWQDTGKRINQGGVHVAVVIEIAAGVVFAIFNSRHDVLVIGGVVLILREKLCQAGFDLAHDAAGFGFVAAALGDADHRHQQSGQDRNDRDHDQHFDQGEAATVGGWGVAHA